MLQCLVEILWVPKEVEGERTDRWMAYLWWLGGCSPNVLITATLHGDWSRALLPDIAEAGGGSSVLDV